MCYKHFQTRTVAGCSALQQEAAESDFSTGDSEVRPHNSRSQRRFFRDPGETRCTRSVQTQLRQLGLHSQSGFQEQEEKRTIEGREKSLTL